jgi:hypothetical protein
MVIARPLAKLQWCGAQATDALVAPFLFLETGDTCSRDYKTDETVS